MAAGDDIEPSFNYMSPEIVGTKQSNMLRVQQIQDSNSAEKVCKDFLKELEESPPKPVLKKRELPQPMQKILKR